MPPAIVVRLDQLLDLLLTRARELGNVGHGELLSALIQAAPTEPEELAAIVADYRWTKVHATLLDARRRTGMHPLPPRKIGRPPSKRE